MSKWKYLGGSLGSTNGQERPHVVTVDMTLGVITIQRIEDEGFWALPKTLRISTHSDLASVQVIDERLTENKAAQGVLAASGYLLAGPLGLFAGFAARKKDEVAFLLEVKSSEDVDDEKVRGAKFALLTRRKYFERILKFSGLAEKSVMEMIDGQIQSETSESLADELEKLSSLKEKGLISEEEFAAAKAKLLGL